MYKTDTKKLKKKQIWNVMQEILGMSVYGYSLQKRYTTAKLHVMSNTVFHRI